MLSKEEKQLRYFPIKILLSFLIITELLVWLGPIEYKINSLLLAPYLIILNFTLWVGYKKGIKSFTPTTYRISSSKIKILLIAGLFLTIISLINLWSSHGLTISLDTLINSLINPGEAYYSDADEVTQTNFLMLFLSPFQWAAIPLGIYFWPKLTHTYKRIVILTIIISIIAWLGIGTRKGVFDIILVVGACVCAANSKKFLQRSFRRKLSIIVAIFISVFLVYFIFSNLSRYGKGGFDDLSEIANINLKKSYDQILGLPLTVALGFITGYLCQGYYALAKGLEIGIIPPAIFGSSWFGIALARKIGFDPTPDTYTKILESQGIDMSINWHTLYLWMANEYTFILVPFIMYMTGYLFAKTWCDSVSKKNPLAYPLMALMVMMVFYAFANNQVFSFSFIPFIFWFLSYELLSKRQLN